MPSKKIGSRPRKPKTGRGKIEMKRIEDDVRRQVCFSKRRTGLFLLASEISMLCGAEVAIITYSTCYNVFSFGQPSVEDVVHRAQQYLEDELKKPQQPANTEVDGVDDDNQHSDDNSPLSTVSDQPSDHPSPTSSEIMSPAWPDLPLAAKIAAHRANKLTQRYATLVADIKTLKAHKGRMEADAEAYPFHKALVEAATQQNLGYNDLLRLGGAMAGLRASIDRRVKEILGESPQMQYLDLMAGASSIAALMDGVHATRQQQFARSPFVKEEGGLLLRYPMGGHDPIMQFLSHG